MVTVKRIIISRARNPYAGEFFVSRDKGVFISTNTKKAYRASPQEMARLQGMSKGQRLNMAQNIRSRKPVGILLRTRIRQR